MIVLCVVAGMFERRRGDYNERLIIYSGGEHDGGWGGEAVSTQIQLEVHYWTLLCDCDVN